MLELRKRCSRAGFSFGRVRSRVRVTDRKEQSGYGGLKGRGVPANKIWESCDVWSVTQSDSVHSFGKGTGLIRNGEGFSKSEGRSLVIVHGEAEGVSLYLSLKSFARLYHSGTIPSSEMESVEEEEKAFLVFC